EMGVRVRKLRPLGYSKMAQQRGAHEMWRTAACRAHADAYVRLAKMDGQQLRMAIGEMEQGDFAGGRRQVIEVVSGSRAAVRERHARCEPDCQRFEELAAPHLKCSEKTSALKRRR